MGPCILWLCFWSAVSRLKCAVRSCPTPVLGIAPAQCIAEFSSGPPPPFLGKDDIVTKHPWKAAEDAAALKEAQENGFLATGLGAYCGEDPVETP